MIYSLTGQAEDLVMTIAEINGKHVKVPMTEEEMFRKILGDEEFEKRRAQAYFEDWGGIEPDPIPEKPFVAEPKKKRYISLVKK